MYRNKLHYIISSEDNYMAYRLPMYIINKQVPTVILKQPPHKPNVCKTNKTNKLSCIYCVNDTTPIQPCRRLFIC